MNKTAALIALMSSQTLPDAPAGDQVPDWVHLLPASAGPIETGDARGPYHVTDAAQMIAASFAETDRLAVDENHATDLAAPEGRPSPARGWIVEMQARSDGIWGRVDWTEAGRQLLADRAYRGISPVIRHTESKGILAILRASLVNKPNLRGLTALNQEQDMSFLERLAKALGLEEGADEAAILKKIKSMGGGDAAQSQISEIGVALGLHEGADADAVLNAAQAAGDTGNRDEIITALQADLTTVTAELGELRSERQRAGAEAFVDAALAENRAGLNTTTRERFITMHMANRENAEAIIKAMPKLGPSGMTLQSPAAKDGEISLNAEQANVAAQLGISPEDYAAALAEDRKETL